MQQFELSRLNAWIEKAQEDIRQALTRNVMRLEESVRECSKYVALSAISFLRNGNFQLYFISTFLQTHALGRATSFPPEVDAGRQC